MCAVCFSACVIIHAKYIRFGFLQDMWSGGGGCRLGIMCEHFCILLWGGIRVMPHSSHPLSNACESAWYLRSGEYGLRVMVEEACQGSGKCLSQQYFCVHVSVCAASLRLCQSKHAHTCICRHVNSCMHTRIKAWYACKSFACVSRRRANTK